MIELLQLGATGRGRRGPPGSGPRPGRGRTGGRGTSTASVSFGGSSSRSCWQSGERPSASSVVEGGGVESRSWPATVLDRPVKCPVERLSSGGRAARARGALVAAPSAAGLEDRRRPRRSGPSAPSSTAELAALPRRSAPGSSEARAARVQHSAAPVARAPVGAGQVGEAPGRRSAAAPTGARKRVVPRHARGASALEDARQPSRVELAARRRTGRGSGRGSARRPHEEVARHPDARRGRRRSAGPPRSRRPPGRSGCPRRRSSTSGSSEFAGVVVGRRGRRRSPRSSKRWPTQRRRTSAPARRAASVVEPGPLGVEVEVRVGVGRDQEAGLVERAATVGRAASAANRAVGSSATAVTVPAATLPPCSPGTFAATAPDKPAVIMADQRRGRHLRRARRRGQPAVPPVPRGRAAAGRPRGPLPREPPPLPRVIWGAHYAGLYYTAMSSRLTTEEMAYIIDDCGAQAFVTSALQGRAGRRAASTGCRGVKVRLDARRRRSTATSRYEAALAAQPADAARRGAGRGPGHALQLGHHRAAQGREGAAARRAARRGRRRRHRRSASCCSAPTSRHRVPLPRAAVPRRAAALLPCRAPPRRHRRRDGALRPRGVPRARRAAPASRSARSCPTMFIRMLKLPDGGAGPVRPVVAAGAWSTPPRRARPR